MISLSSPGVKSYVIVTVIMCRVVVNNHAFVAMSYKYSYILKALGNWFIGELENNCHGKEKAQKRVRNEGEREMKDGGIMNTCDGM